MNSFPHSIDIIPGVLQFVVADHMSVSTTRRIAAFVREIDALQPDGMVEIIPSYASITVIYDKNVSPSPKVEQCCLDIWKRTLHSHVEEPADNITVDVVYGDSFGDDLTNVAANAGKSVEEVITVHASGSYTVGAVGFVPGFTYLIGLPPSLTTPRRASPRLQVPPGSVGIGGNQTGIYALPSAGGWNLIGRSPTTLFDPAADPPVALKLGDSLSFRRIEEADFSHLTTDPVGPTGDGPIEVVSAGMQTTVQDLGRYGMARYGVATDGAADRASLVDANQRVGNPPQAAALELTHQGPTLRFHRRLRFAFAGADLGARLNRRPLPLGRVFETMPGDELTCIPHPNTSGARAYLAVKGGFDVPLVMGSASTSLSAGIGGWHGRALVAGDRIGVGQEAFPTTVFTPGMQPKTSCRPDAPFRIVPGPQRHRFSDATWQRLLSERFTVSGDANRVGIRLLGPSLAPESGADILSEGLVTGSIQVTGEGQAIVMLPGHATIGGYTRIATVIAEDWDRLGQLSPGDEIRLEAVDQAFGM